jgi:hypothetical protein
MNIIFYWVVSYKYRLKLNCDQIDVYFKNILLKKYYYSSIYNSILSEKTKLILKI